MATSLAAIVQGEEYVTMPRVYADVSKGIMERAAIKSLK
jgi:hypothetical protein